MAEDEAGITTADPVGDPTDPQQAWQTLDAGLKARAMKSIHEEQQKLVVDLGRKIMDMQTEIAISVARAKALDDIHRSEDRQKLWDSEVVPKREELLDLRQKVKEERDLLDAFEAMGKGII